jgi:hypothetical protein
MLHATTSAAGHAIVRREQEDEGLELCRRVLAAADEQFNPDRMMSRFAVTGEGV